MSSLALIGYPLSHSFSKAYFESKFSQLGLHDWQYDLWPMEDLNALKNKISIQKDLVGFNVTIPHKQNILPLCSSLSKEAEMIGAVNCVAVVRKDNELFLAGHNTDVYGFEKSLVGWYKPKSNKAIIFGDGGAAKAVKFVLNKLNIRFIQIVRNAKNEHHITIDNLNKAFFSSYDLIVNCTPVGMFPDVEDVLPIKREWINSSHQYYDLVYNPEVTTTMKLFLEQSASAKNGLEMLHLQADKAWEIWQTQQ